MPWCCSNTVVMVCQISFPAGAMQVVCRYHQVISRMAVIFSPRQACYSHVKGTWNRNIIHEWQYVAFKACLPNISHSIWIRLDCALFSYTFPWRHNEHDCVSNHQPCDCLLQRLFRCRSKKTSELRVTGLCAGTSPVIGEFPAQLASDAEDVSIWWRHNVISAQWHVWSSYTLVLFWWNINDGVLKNMCKPLDT